MAGADMDVARLLLGHRGLPGVVVAARCLVVVADEDPGLVGQREDLLDRGEEGLGRTAREIAARGAEVGHEQGVADEGGVADDIGQAGRRVARGVQHPRREAADREAVAVDEEPVELAAVALELGALVEDLAEGVLDDADVLADADPAAQPLLQIGRGREVVGMDVGFEDPLDLQPVVAEMGDDGVGRAGVGVARGIVEVEHGIDHRAGLACRVLHHIGNGVGRLVEKGGNVGLDELGGVNGLHGDLRSCFVRIYAACITLQALNMLSPH